MKIEIEIDINNIAQQAIKELIKESVVIHDTSAGVKIGETIPTVQPGLAKPAEVTTTENTTPVEWEYGPKPGRRRSKEEIALHELELKYNRLLTPEEKGQTKAVIEIDDIKETKAKEDTMQKQRIEEMAKEGMEAASKELANETDSIPDPAKENEETIPKTEDININSMFT